MQRETMPH